MIHPPYESADNLTAPAPLGATPRLSGNLPLTSLPLAGLRVLGISPTPTHPTIAGNRARYRALLDRLVQLGATVRFVHIRHEPGDLAAMRAHWKGGGATELQFTMPVPRHDRWNRFAKNCRRFLGLPLVLRTDVDDWCDVATRSQLHTEVADFRPHAVFMVYFWNSLLLEGLEPNILKVLDAQDVFTNRNERMRRANIDMDWFSVSAAQEKRGLDRFDVILAIQEHEAEHYRSLTTRKVVTVGHLLPSMQSAAPPSTPKLLMVGSDNPINVDGANWFLHDVWPAVLAARPDATLNIVGRLCAHIPESAGVTLSGPVDNLDAVYYESAVVVCPLRGGTGLKIKSAEALAAGRVVVSTRSAAEGLEEAVGHGMIIADDAAHMSSEIIQILGDIERLRFLSLEATRFSHRWNERSAKAFDEVFTDVAVAQT